MEVIGYLKNSYALASTVLCVLRLFCGMNNAKIASRADCGAKATQTARKLWFLRPAYDILRAEIKLQQL